MLTVNHRSPARLLVCGEDLSLLRRLLPPLGLLMAIAGVGGWMSGELNLLAACVIAALGVAAALWSLRMTTRRFVFDNGTQLVHVSTRQGARRSEESLRFEDVQTIVLRVVEGYRRGPDFPLAGVMSFQLLLLTNGRELTLSRLAQQGLQECEAEARRVLEFLGQSSPETLLARSYRHALDQRNRLQAIWLARLLTPRASLDEAAARVREDWPA